MNLKEVSVDMVNELKRREHRGRTSYPIIKMFLESPLQAAEVDLEGIQSSRKFLGATLSAYVKAHDIPVRVVNRGGKIYLVKVLSTEGPVKVLKLGQPTEITDSLVMSGHVENTDNPSS